MHADQRAAVERVREKAGRPVCDACKDAPGSEPGSGQHRLVGASLCRDCFLEWYDGNRPEPRKNNNSEAIGEWVRRCRAERQGIATIPPAPSAPPPASKEHP